MRDADEGEEAVQGRFYACRLADRGHAGKARSSKGIRHRPPRVPACDGRSPPAQRGAWRMTKMTKAELAEDHLEALRLHAWNLNRVREERDNAIRRAVKAGVKATDIAEAVALTRARVYQIAE